VGHPNEPWNVPTTIGGSEYYAGAPLVATQQFGRPFPQTDVFVVDRTGHLNVFWAIGGHTSEGPAKTTDAIFDPGAKVADRSSSA
jgi:hypothetical protein